MYVYVIGGIDPPVKIGTSVRPRSRLYEIQTGSALKVDILAAIRFDSSDAAILAESEVHHRFRQHCVRGEWFNVRADEAISAIQAIAALPHIGMSVAISSCQSRAARALLGWSREVLADKAEIAERTLIDFERGAREPNRATLRAIETAFDIAGIGLIYEDDAGGPGVRRKRGKRK